MATPTAIRQRIVRPPPRRRSERTYGLRLATASSDPGNDVVGGDIMSNPLRTVRTFTACPITGAAEPDCYSNWESPQPPAHNAAAFSWSKNSSIYHFSSCKIVRTSRKANLQTGNTPPTGKTLHPLCPQWSNLCSPVYRCVGRGPA